MLRFQCNVANIEDDTIKYADISARCDICHKPAVFRSDLPLGVNWRHPTLSMDAQELSLPFTIEGDEFDEDKPRPSYSIKVRGPGT